MSRKYPTLESFIVASKVKHGDLYEYPDQPWPPENQYARIVCRTHGQFLQRYFNHVRSAGCPQCWESRRGSTKRLTESEVIESIKAKFPSYIVDASGYKNNESKLSIICPTHGVFKGTYSDLAGGHGCPSCGKEKGMASRKSKLFPRVSKALAEMFPSLSFPYLEKELISTTSLITVVCPKHGESKKRPHKMLSGGQGCPLCGKENSIEKRKLKADEVFAKFAQVHGDTYDYSKSTFDTVMDNTTIVCKKHGEFTQTPQAHYSGQGCPRCGIERRALSSVVPFQDFLLLAREVHGNKYEYNEGSYGGTSKHVTITCSVHGAFSQLAVAHLYGSDCPSCSNFGFNPSKKAHVYVYKIVKEGQQFVGFGISNNLRNRNADHQKTFSEHGAEGQIVAKFLYRKGKYAAELESTLLSSIPIVSTGMAGFIREAARWEEFDKVLSLSEAHHKVYGSEFRA